MEEIAADGDISKELLKKGNGKEKLISLWLYPIIAVFVTATLLSKVSSDQN